MKAWVDSGCFVVVRSLWSVARNLQGRNKVECNNIELHLAFNLIISGGLKAKKR